MAEKMNQIAIKIEKSLPQIMVVSSVVAVVLLSLTISSSHIVHHPDTKNILSGKDAKDKANGEFQKLIQVNTTLTQLISNKLEGPPGATGLKGTKGEQGEKGEKGYKGEPGIRGDMGRKGNAGEDGPQGQKGDIGPRGIRGQGNGTKGAIGPKGEKGDKGEGPFVPKGPIEMELGSNSKGDTKVYKITCHGPICRDLSLQVKISRGDADLYGKEDEPPQIYESNCASCTCKSRGSDLVDKCLVTTEDSNIFYAAVYAHKSYHDAKLKVDGPNLETVEYDRGDSHIQDEDDV